MPHLYLHNVVVSCLVDFTETGQIGDTIGGTMSPIVAIAGVFMTFIAFLMQINANRIQSEQLRKTFNLRLLENRIESRNALQLMSVDINVMIKEIVNYHGLGITLLIETWFMMLFLLWYQMIFLMILEQHILLWIYIQKV